MERSNLWKAAGSGVLFERGMIHSTEYESTSILKFIAERFGLDPLPSRRFRAVTSFSGAFDFSGE